MAQFTKKDRQRIIDGYLSETGKNMFVAGEFIDWLSEQSDHEAYPWFFSKSDGEAAREYRIGLARQMASGLRIAVKDTGAAGKGSVVSLTVREYPAYVSPVAGRKSGGRIRTLLPGRRGGVGRTETTGGHVFERMVAAIFRCHGRQRR